MRRDDKVRDDGDGLDLLGPGEGDAVADAERRLRRLLARVDAARRLGQHLADGDLGARHVLGLEGLEIRADEAAEECRAHVVGVSFYTNRISQLSVPCVALLGE